MFLLVWKRNITYPNSVKRVDGIVFSLTSGVSNPEVEEYYVYRDHPTMDLPAQHVLAVRNYGYLDNVIGEASVLVLPVNK